MGLGSSRLRDGRVGQEESWVVIGKTNVLAGDRVADRASAHDWCSEGMELREGGPANSVVCPCPKLSVGRSENREVDGVGERSRPASRRTEAQMKPQSCQGAERTRRATSFRGLSRCAEAFVKPAWTLEWSRRGGKRRAGNGEACVCARET